MNSRKRLFMNLLMIINHTYIVLFSEQAPIRGFILSIFDKQWLIIAV
jgi:hypothetical protein